MHLWREKLDHFGVFGRIFEQFLGEFQIVVKRFTRMNKNGGKKSGNNSLPPKKPLVSFLNHEKELSSFFVLRVKYFFWRLTNVFFSKFYCLHSIDVHKYIDRTDTENRKLFAKKSHLVSQTVEKSKIKKLFKEFDKVSRAEKEIQTVSSLVNIYHWRRKKLEIFSAFSPAVLWENSMHEFWVLCRREETVFCCRVLFGFLT